MAAATGLTEAQVLHVYRDIDTKRSTTCFLHQKPVLVEEVTDVG